MHIRSKHEGKPDWSYSCWFFVLPHGNVVMSDLMSWGSFVRSCEWEQSGRQISAFTMPSCSAPLSFSLSLFTAKEKRLARSFCLHMDCCVVNWKSWFSSASPWAESQSQTFSNLYGKELKYNTCESCGLCLPLHVIPQSLQLLLPFFLLKVTIAEV